MAALRFLHIAGKKLKKKNLNTSTVFRELFPPTSFFFHLFLLVEG